MNAGAQTSTLDSSQAITLGGNQTWGNSSSSSLNVAGNITNAALALTLSSNANSAGNINVSGSIVGGTAGTVTINSAGAGIVHAIRDEHRDRNHDIGGRHSPAQPAPGRSVQAR